MSYIYYFIGIIFLIRSLSRLLRPKEITLRRFDAIAEGKAHDGNKTGDWSKYTPAYKNYAKKLIPSLLLLLWVFIGLLSFQWVMFLGFIIVTFVFINPLHKLLNKSLTAASVLQFITSLLTILFLTFVIINGIHLKITSFEILEHLKIIYIHK